MFKLKNKVAVITGGSSGIGLAIAKLFAEHGAKIVITGRNKDKLEKAKADIKSDAVVTIESDVSKVSDIESMYEEVYKSFGKIGILVANAGLYDVKPLEDIDEDFFDKIVDVNYKGLFFSVQKAIDYLAKGSSVILMSSAAAHLAYPKRSVYGSTKAAASMLARYFTSDLAASGVRINAISPGRIKTPILDVLSKEETDAMNAQIPMGRMGEASDVAKLALFLASDDSSYITGSDIIIDGGLSRAHVIK